MAPQHVRPKEAQLDVFSQAAIPSEVGGICAERLARFGTVHSIESNACILPIGVQSGKNIAIRHLGDEDREVFGGVYRDNGYGRG